MVTLDSLSQKSAIVCTENNDIVILDNFHYFGIQSIVSFTDDISPTDENVYFEKYFQKISQTLSTFLLLHLFLYNLLI